MKNLKEKMAIDIIGQIKSRKKTKKYSVKKLQYQELKKLWKKQTFKDEVCEEFNWLIKEIYVDIKLQELGKNSTNLGL